MVIPSPAQEVEPLAKVVGKGPYEDAGSIVDEDIWVGAEQTRRASV